MAVEHPQRRDSSDHEIAVAFFFGHRVVKQVQVVQMLQSAENAQRALKVLEPVAVEAKLLDELEVNERAAVERPGESKVSTCCEYTPSRFAFRKPTRDVPNAVVVRVEVLDAEALVQSVQGFDLKHDGRTSSVPCRGEYD